MIGRTIGRFRVLAKLGQGGMATVWKGYDELIGREVALKLLADELVASPKARRRFLHEAQATGALDHPGIVRIFDAAECDGVVYIALSLVDGETLSERVARRLMPIPEAVRVISDAGAALAYAHSRGVIHRDVTGRNVMIDRDGRVVVLDFGLALASWESRVTTSGAIAGTPHYMAPEVLGGGDATPRSDLYSLGVVLYEALTGGLPHRGEHPTSVYFGVLNQAPRSARSRRPDIPEALDSVLCRALERDPTARYATIEDFLAALARVSSGEPAAALGRETPAGGDAGAGRQESTDGAIPGRPDPMYLGIRAFQWEAEGPLANDVAHGWTSRLAPTLEAALGGGSQPRVVPSGDVDLTAPDAARALGVNAILSGHVQQRGASLRVSFEVRDASSGARFDAATLEGSVMQLRRLEEQLVSRVARAVAADHVRWTSPPPDPAASDRYQQALGYLRRHDTEASVDGAINVLERITASNGDVAAYHATLARACLYKYDHSRERSWESRAAVSCQRARELGPQEPEVLVAYGHVLLRAGKADQALHAFQEALRIDPGCVDARLGCARAHLAEGRHDEAERAAIDATRSSPSDWKPFLELGRIRCLAGRYSEAIEPTGRALELTPDNAMVLRLMAGAWYASDRLEEAADAYRRSLAIVPNVEAYSNLGTALYFLGHSEEALSAFRKATELTPSDPLCWGNLGSACRWLPGHDGEAATALDRAILIMRERLEANPRHAMGWARLAGWLANRDRLAEAEAAIGRALETEPGNIDCMVRAGHVYHQIGNRAECFRWFRTARAAGYGVGELLRSRALADLRDDPEFQSLLDSARPPQISAHAEAEGPVRSVPSTVPSSFPSTKP